MDNRQKWSIGMAFVGGLAASLGEVRNPIDTLLGAAIVGGITYGIASFVISQKAALMALNKKPLNSDRTSISNSGGSDANVPDDMKDFLQSLEIVEGRHDGWYKDPSSLYKLRFFQNGKWTLAVSNSDSTDEKSDALLKFLTPASPKKSDSLKTELDGRDSLPVANTSSTNMNQKIEQIERIAELRRNGIITEQEFENLKNDIFKII